MELKSNFGNTKGALDSEKSVIEKMQTELKNVFFRVVQLMLKEEEQSILLNAVMIFIQYMQLTYVIFNRQIWKVWQNEIVTQRLNQIFGYPVSVNLDTSCSLPISSCSALKVLSR